MPTHILNEHVTGFEIVLSRVVTAPYQLSLSFETGLYYFSWHLSAHLSRHDALMDFLAEKAEWQLYLM